VNARLCIIGVPNISLIRREVPKGIIDVPLGPKGTNAFGLRFPLMKELQMAGEAPKRYGIIHT